MREQTSKARGWLGARKADGPLHPQSYYNRSSESLLKRVYTGLGVDSGRPSWSLVSAQLRSFVPSLVQRPRLYIYTCSYRQCVHGATLAHPRTPSNAYLIVACMNSESRSTRGYEPDPS